MAKKETNTEFQKSPRTDMSVEEAKAYRAAAYKPKTATLSDAEKRERFRLFWTKSRKKYGKSKQLEQILWVYLKATGHDDPEKFEAGIRHFGFKIGK